MDGVNSVFLGPGDLSHEVGSPWEKNEAGEPVGEVANLIAKVVAGCQRKKKKLIGFPFPSIDFACADRQLRTGFDAVCYGMDYLVLSNTFLEIARHFEKTPRT